VEDVELLRLKSMRNLRFDFGFNSFYNEETPQPYDQFRFSQVHEPYLRAMMGTRYGVVRRFGFLCSAEQKPTDPGAKLRLEVQGYKLFENGAYMGRLTLVHTLAGIVKEENQFIAESSPWIRFSQERLHPGEGCVPPGGFSFQDIHGNERGK